MFARERLLRARDAALLNHAERRARQRDRCWSEVELLQTQVSVMSRVVEQEEEGRGGAGPLAARGVEQMTKAALLKRVRRLLSSQAHEAAREREGLIEEERTRGLEALASRERLSAEAAEAEAAT